MTEPVQAALEHIRRVADSVLGGTSVTVANPGGSGGAVNILSVPYVSQLGTGASQHTNDSGAAAGAMLVGAYTGTAITPDAFYIKTGQTGDKALTLAQILKALSASGVPVEQRSSLKLSDLALTLTSGRPAILLVKQAVLQQAGLTTETTSGSHYLVGVGLDVKQVFIHDPLRQDSSGQAQGIPWLTFYDAWTQGEGAVRSALVPRLQLFRRMCVNAPLVNVRQQPGASSSLVGTVKQGEIYEITVQKSGWGLIGEGRWVSLSYLVDI